MNSSNITVDIYSDFKQIEDFITHWDHFAESVHCGIFDTYEFCKLWWKYFGTDRKLLLFIFKKENEILGIFPLFSEQIRLGIGSVKAVKTIGSDFCSGLICPMLDVRYCIPVFTLLMQKLEEEIGFDVLYLGPFSSLAQNVEGYLSDFEQVVANDYTLFLWSPDSQTVFKLSDSWDSYWRNLGQKRRHEVSRKKKKLAQILRQEEVPINARLASKEESASLFNNFYDMHQKHWQKHHKCGHFGDWPKSKEFHYDLAQNQCKENRLRLLEVSAGPVVLGYKYGYQFGDIYVEYLDSRLDEEIYQAVSLGDIIFLEQVKIAIHDKAAYIDSMTGIYDHKRRMGGEVRMVRSALVYPKKWGKKIKITGLRLLAKALHIGYYKIWFCRLAPKLPFKRKPLWNSWIRTNMFA